VLTFTDNDVCVWRHHLCVCLDWKLHLWLSGLWCAFPIGRRCRMRQVLSSCQGCRRCLQQGRLCHHSQVLSLLLSTVSSLYCSLCPLGERLHLHWFSRIDALLKRAYEWSSSEHIVTVSELLNKSGTSLFQKMHSSSHCLNPLLPSKKIISYNLRNTNNGYVLPQCKLYVFMRSFINWCHFTL